jgi:predicted DNA-binding antitoxin AbrB/MazE fold protein
MRGTIRARVKRGMLELLDNIDLPEGTEVMVTILAAPSPEDREASRRAAGGWKGTVHAEELIQNIYADRLIATRPVPQL